MGNEIVQGNYQALEQVSQRFSRNAEATAALQRQVERSANALRQGGWQGRGAGAFFAELDGVVLPSVQRLASALQQGSVVTRQITEVMRTAEEEAGQPFRKKDTLTQSFFVNKSDSSTGIVHFGIPSLQDTPIDAPPLYILLMRMVHGGEVSAYKRLNEMFKENAAFPLWDLFPFMSNDIASLRGDTGFQSQFQDNHLYETFWGGKGTISMQVGHFFTAVAMGYNQDPLYGYLSRCNWRL